MPSRRGYKGPRRNTAQNPHKRHASSSPTDSTAGDSCPMLLGHAPVSSLPMSMPPMSVSVPTSSFNPAIVLPDTPSTSPYAAATPVAAASHMQLYRTPFAATAAAAAAAIAVAPAGPPTPPITSLAERCFDSFYYHFYAAHPYVLPKECFLRLLKDTPAGSLDHLLAAMRYIGSLYLDAGPARAMFLDEALRLAYLPTCPQDGFLLQALLMLVVALDGNCQQDRARQLLADCERIAIELGLNSRDFAAANGRGSPVLEESWRRTWWDLYVVDGMIAGVHRVTNFLLFDVNCDVALPCEEHQYLSGVSTCTPRTPHPPFC